MFLKGLFLGITGVSFGLLVAGGVFTVFVTVGLIPRFAGKTHTGRYVTIYESCVNGGAIFGCILSVFPSAFQMGKYHILAAVILICFGFFAGMFEGCFAIAIAEMLNTIPIFFRRVGFRHGLGIAILMIALGKIAGTIFYFSKHVYLFGGV